MKNYPIADELKDFIIWMRRKNIPMPNSEQEEDAAVGAFLVQRDKAKRREMKEYRRHSLNYPQRPYRPGQSSS